MSRGPRNYYFIILERWENACSYRGTRDIILERERTLTERAKNYYFRGKEYVLRGTGTIILERERTVIERAKNYYFREGKKMHAVTERDKSHYFREGKNSC